MMKIRYISELVIQYLLTALCDKMQFIFMFSAILRFVLRVCSAEDVAYKSATQQQLNSSTTAWLKILVANI